jgi:hypothetical protein
MCCAHIVIAGHKNKYSPPNHLSTLSFLKLTSSNMAAGFRPGSLTIVDFHLTDDPWRKSLNNPSRSSG